MSMNKIFYLLFLILLSTIILADDVIILKLHYSNGKITLIDKEIKIGYDPDRLIEPEEGYRLEIISEQNTVLHSFLFELPNKLYIDEVKLNNKLSGGYIILDNFDFSLVVPYFKDIKEIKIYDEFNRQKINIEKDDIQLSQPRNNWIFYFIVILSIILIIIFIYKKIKK